MPFSPPRDRVPDLVVLGAGLTGLAAASTWEGSLALFEARDEVGGHARTIREQGYAFDITGHFLHLRSQEIREWVFALTSRDAWTEVERITAIVGPQGLIPYPFQANLSALPTALAGRALGRYVQSQIARTPDAGVNPGFGAYIRNHFGDAMAELFFEPYNRKLWGECFELLDSTWMSRFLPIPSRAQVIRGAFPASSATNKAGLGYNARFLVSRSGGIDALAGALQQSIVSDPRKNLALHHEVSRIDVKRRRIEFVGQSTSAGYERLISTLPLPTLIAALDGVPAPAKNAARSLRWIDWHYFDLALHGPTAFPFHWLYVPDPTLPFFRVGSYANVCPAAAPPGSSSLYVEMSPMHADASVDDVVKGLLSIGVIKTAHDVRFIRKRLAPCAYVVSTAETRDALALIFDALKSAGIVSCGRYGSWTYNSMEDCLIAGRASAKALEIEMP
jgi:protoporphyrinogen oxidase